MKKLLSLLLAVLMLITMCACGEKTPAANDATEPKINTTATDADIAQLEALYKDRIAYHGDMHNHSDSGGRSDGKTPLKLWPTVVLEPKEIDFAVIVDHKQTSHMRLPEWDVTKYVGGSEAATTILDDHLDQGGMHYNMIFNDWEALEELLRENEEYNLRDDEENPGNNTFKYAKFSGDRFREIVAQIREKGGFFVQVHPLFSSYIKSNNPLDYWYGDYTGFEIYTSTSHDYFPDHEAMQKAYKTWVDMLNLGKIVYATCGSDDHRDSSAHSLSTFYASEQHADAFLELMRKGDFSAGPVGIRMAMGDVVTGGQTAFTGKRLVISVGDWHPQAINQPHNKKSEFRLDIYNEKGLVTSIDLAGTETQYFAIDAENCQYYRAEVYDVTNGYWLSVGNPIWNTEATATTE